MLEVAKAHRSVRFPYEVPAIEPKLETLKASANFYLLWDSRMVLSQSEMQGASSTGSHETVYAVVAVIRGRSDPIHVKVHPAEKKLAEIQVQAADNAKKREERGVNTRRLDRLQNSIISVIYKMEQVTKVH